MLELRTLGTLDLRQRDGPELASVLSQPKRTGLLCYLALARPRGFHRRDKLLALFWPETDTEHARASLRQAVRFLRRALGESAVQSRGDEELSLGEGVLACDAREFEDALVARDAGRALALYEGDLLPGFYVDGAPEFERWLETERSRLRERAVAGAWSLAEACERAGDGGGAAEWGRRALAIAPADDGALRRLMQLLERLGDADGALAAYHSGSRRLRLEYDIEPSLETRELGEEICERVRAAAARLGSTRAGERPGLGEAARSGPGVASVGGLPAPDRSGTPGAEPVPRNAASRRRLVAVAIALTVLLGAAGAWLAWQRRAAAAHPRRLVVAPFENRTGDESLAPLGDMAADWIAQGLSESGIAEVANASAARAIARQASAPAPDLVRTLARGTGSALVVAGRYYRKADSVAFVAQVLDAPSGRLLVAVGPVTARTSAPVTAVDRLRELMLVRLAILLDERLPARRMDFPPPSYEAYREFMAGIERAETRDEYAEAADNYLRAFALDSSFYHALVAASYAAMMHGPRSRYDSLQPILERVRDRLSPNDLRGLQYQRAYRANDYGAMYTLMHDAIRPARAPADGTLFGAAVSAGRVHRYRESLALMRRMDPDRPLTPKWYWAYLGGAQHALGDYRGQLRAAAEMARRSPRSVAPDAMRMVAHAALGHVAEVRRLALALATRAARDTMFFQEVGNMESLGVPPRTPAVAFFLAARELAAHGNDAEARQLVDDGLRWSAARPASERADTTFRWVHAQLLGMAGRWQEADTILPASPPPGWNPPLQWSRAMLAARLGGGARVSGIDLALGASPGPVQEFQHVAILAALGRREEARIRLRELLSGGGLFGEWWVHTEPALAPYLAEPEIRRLLRADG